MRFTIHFRHDVDYEPKINCDNLEDIATHIMNNEEGDAFRVFDNQNSAWLSPETVLMACILSAKN